MFLLGPKGGTETETEVDSTCECSVFLGGKMLYKCIVLL